MTLAAVQQAAGATLAEAGDRSVPAHFGDPAGELAAARGGIALFDLSHRGRLRMVGGGRLGYLHRVTAQAFRELVPPAGTLASILERTGKIVEVLTAHAFDDHLLLLTSAANRTKAAEWLSRFIFRDDVRLEDVTSTTGQLLLLGPGAHGAARALAGDRVDGLAAHAWTPTVAPPGTMIRAARETGEAYWLIGDEGEMPALWDAALATGAVPAGLAAYEAWRVLRGVPEGGAEIDQDANPLELGLDASLSLTKGCFTGQEAIAKMITHQAVRRRLVGLRLEGEALPPRGAPLRAADDVVGRVTTAIQLPGNGERLALGLCRTEHAEPGTRLGYDGGEAEVAALPFATP